MKKKTILLLLSLSVFASLFFVWNQTQGFAQIKAGNDGFYMYGSIEKTKMMTGFFSKNRSDIDKKWFVFVADTGSIFKFSLLDKNVQTLFIDGQKIPDDQIGKYSPQYKPFVEKILRENEIEKESAELESKIKPLDRKIEAIDKEIEKLDIAEEKLDKDSEKNQENYTENRKSLKAQQKKLSKIQEGLDKQIEELSEQQEKLSNEQESLNLMGELDKVLEQISEDLKSLGIIKSSNNLSFKLSNKELVVNGKKISPEAFELLKTKYIFETSGESGFLFRWKLDV